jgi:hypothetical protein
MNDEELPSISATAFCCPYCNTYAHQHWRDPAGNYLKKPPALSEFWKDRYKTPVTHQNGSFIFVTGVHFSSCSRCDGVAVWVSEKLVFPRRIGVPLPHEELPTNIKADYLEASSVLQDSPRSAAALLRLGLQKLCMHLGQPGENLNSDINSLVSDGLPVSVQQALHSLRVIGNESVHPGKMDMRDDSETATKLFKMLNFIVEKMISEPRQIAELFSELPENKRPTIRGASKETGT